MSIALKGDDANKALTAFRAHIREWGIALPSVKPLALDFGLGDFQRTGLIEYWIANEEAAGYCGKYLFVFDGQTCPTHKHKEKVETFFVVKGRVRIIHCGRSMKMKAGDTLKVERGEPHSFTGIGAALLLELSTPCVVSDNYFENTNIPIGGNYES